MTTSEEQMAESNSPQTYVVRQGEYLEQIAYKLGFDAEAVWAHEKNEDLRKSRKDHHHILCAGDILYIPATDAQPDLSLTTGQDNNYQTKIPERTVELKLRNEDGPLANEEYTIEGLEDPIQGTSDEEGKVSFPVPITTRDVRLILKNHGVFDLGVGDLDPLSETTGVQMRLAALGFHWSAPTGEIDDDTRYAIKRFQRENGFEITGELTPETLSAIEKAYGW
jgi:hypothetical protein